MIKIQFLLQKPNEKQDSLEHITISEPKVDKSQKFDWGNRYVCNVYMSNVGKTIPYYGINPIETLCGASEFVKNYCQGLLKNNFIISEVESKEPWKLKKMSENFLEEEINKIKKTPDISRGDIQKILEIIKESFGGELSPIKDQVNKLI